MLAERAGIERGDRVRGVRRGAAAAPFVLYKRAAFEHPDETPGGVRPGPVAKDLDLILALAREVGARMPQATQNRATVQAALDAGFSAPDLSAVASYLRALP